MFQLAGANLERAAAATDMVGRAAAPPDVFESAATPRGGRGIEQRLVALFDPAGTRPAGYAADTPRARLAPAADAFVARRLGDASRIVVRLMDADGFPITAPTLSSLGFSALDLAALDLSTENIMLASVGPGPSELGAPTANPGRQGVARLLAATGVAGAVSFGTDPDEDGALLDLLDHAAAWQHALAGRPPLSADTFVGRAELVVAPDASALAATVAAFAQELANAAAPALAAWGIGGLDADTARQVAAARVAAAAALADPVQAAGALLGAPAIVEGTLAALPPDVLAGVADPAAVLGPRAGVLARWLQDSARVRAPAQRLVDAMLRDDLAGAAAVGCWAAQTPAAPYAAEVDAAAARQWVGQRFPAAARRRSGDERGARRRRAAEGRGCRHRARCVDRGRAGPGRHRRRRREPRRARRARSKPDPARRCRRTPPSPGRPTRCCRSSTRRSSSRSAGSSTSTPRSACRRCCRRST